MNDPRNASRETALLVRPFDDPDPERTTYGEPFTEVWDDDEPQVLPRFVVEYWERGERVDAFSVMSTSDY
jgi:hypothetical protein